MDVMLHNFVFINSTLDIYIWSVHLTQMKQIYQQNAQYVQYYSYASRYHQAALSRTPFNI